MPGLRGDVRGRMPRGHLDEGPEGGSNLGWGPRRPDGLGVEVGIEAAGCELWARGIEAARGGLWARKMRTGPLNCAQGNCKRFR